MEIVQADEEANRLAQAELYGEPLGELIGRCASVLSLTQSRIAGLLGISAPMLSQLVHARRVKLGNPVAVQRLQLMHEVVRSVGEGEIGVAEAIAMVEENSESSDVFTRTSTRTRHVVPLQIQELFRVTAAAGDFVDAAEQLEASHPQIAELLRVYGSARADEAVEHYESARQRLR